MRVPASAYRFQLHAGFTFHDAAARIPYLRELGITDCYCSPIFRAAPDSTHGYDVADFSEINPDLGGEEGFLLLSRVLQENGMGLLLDFVPNHMGMCLGNSWWRDVLEKGRRSEHAGTFDIEWQHEKSPDEDRITLPLLRDHYGVLLEEGSLHLALRGEGICLVEGDLAFPLRAESYRRFLPCIPSTDTSPDPEDAEAVKAHVLGRVATDTHCLKCLHREMNRLHGIRGNPSSFDEIDAIVREQHYRLARWQAGIHGTRYRRFFTINTLIALRIEDPRVFSAVHEKLKQLVDAGHVTGLRIDHIDGLRDPKKYLEDLQAIVSKNGEPFYVVVEKILSRDEPLRHDWATAGTTGYEFIASLQNLFIEAKNEAAINAIYQAFTGETGNFDDEVVANKRRVIHELFRSTMLSLATQLVAVLRIDRRWRDYTVSEIADALAAFVAAFSVYRTYRQRELADEADMVEIVTACEDAIAENPRIEAKTLQFIRDVLTGDYPETGATDEHKALVAEWAITFQQYSGAIMAKGVEDTTFYTYNRLCALNEVGGDPAQFGGDATLFHQANRTRLLNHPYGLITTSTHDTKMSEDVRARLYALSEIPHEWRQWLQLWRELNAQSKTWINGRWAPDANEEYRFYQMLIGAWPQDAGEPDDAFRDRMAGYVCKAVSEAKQNSTLAAQNQAWLDACERFAREALRPRSPFVARIRTAAARLACLGVVNSLAQVVLKLCSPGVPDIYQGNETWDFSLVDPDNRRPVNFNGLETLAKHVAASSNSPRDVAWATSEIKWRITQRLLQFRKSHADLFARGTYEPLAFEGRLSRNLVGFVRRQDLDTIAVIIPRLVGEETWPPVADVWGATTVQLPPVSNPWTDVISGHRHTPQEKLPMQTIFLPFPVAVLHSKADSA